jgi:hypothetical protein
MLYSEHVCAGFDPYASVFFPRGMQVLTPGGFDHILLANIEFWKPSGWSFARLFERMFGEYGAPSYPTVGSNWQFIWEPDIAGAVRFPEGVKTLVASFPELFGTK